MGRWKAVGASVKRRSFAVYPEAANQLIAAAIRNALPKFYEGRTLACRRCIARKKSLAKVTKVISFGFR